MGIVRIGSDRENGPERLPPAARRGTPSAPCACAEPGSAGSSLVRERPRQHRPMLCVVLCERRCKPSQRCARSRLRLRRNPRPWARTQRARRRMCTPPLHLRPSVREVHARARFEASLSTADRPGRRSARAAPLIRARRSTRSGAYVSHPEPSALLMSEVPLLFRDGRRRRSTTDTIGAVQQTPCNVRQTAGACAACDIRPNEHPGMQRAASQQ
jgi:hypothetical protein